MESADGSRGGGLIARAQEVVDAVRAPLLPIPERLRNFYFGTVKRYTLGLVSFRDLAFHLGPLTLISFQPPVATASGWRFELRGGLLVREAAGSLEVSWRDGRLELAVRGYRPRLPRPLYAVTQLPFHHFLTRLVLLQLRGRLPAVAPPATPLARLGAGGVDLALCLVLSATLARGRPWPALTIAAAYHVAAWRWGGRTAGGWLLGQRVRSIDGSPLTTGQALVRLLVMPWGVARLRAVHDEVAGTDVVRSWPAAN